MEVQLPSWRDVADAPEVMTWTVTLPLAVVLLRDSSTGAGAADTDVVDVRATRSSTATTTAEEKEQGFVIHGGISNAECVGAFDTDMVYIHFGPFPPTSGKATRRCFFSESEIQSEFCIIVD